MCPIKNTFIDCSIGSLDLFEIFKKSLKVIYLKMKYIFGSKNSSSLGRFCVPCRYVPHAASFYVTGNEERKKLNIHLNGPMLKVMFRKNQMQRQRQYT